jgi:hypothetical protein
VGVYAGIVLLATEVLGLHGTVAVAVATLAAAALFNPLRRRAGLEPGVAGRAGGSAITHRPGCGRILWMGHHWLARAGPV